MMAKTIPSVGQSRSIAATALARKARIRIGRAQREYVFGCRVRVWARPKLGVTPHEVRGTGTWYLVLGTRYLVLVTRRIIETCAL